MYKKLLFLIPLAAALGWCELISGSVSVGGPHYRNDVAVESG